MSRRTGIGDAVVPLRPAAALEETADWKRVWNVFEAALGLPPDERGVYLDRTCDGDRDLRRAVEEMLDADAEPSPLLDHPVAERSTRDDPPVVRRAPSVNAAPRTIGPYRVLRQLGQGGMSTVYLAVPDDQAFHRRVVIKVVRQDLQSRLLDQRLVVERQILASLNHPNIARLYDGGANHRGAPYFVMEFVDGVAIDTYCAQNRLALDERLTLFRKVCDAVTYAHQNLVIHRDLKPSNILATADGEPKLLDFGIAKLLNPELAGDGLDVTATGQRALTPSYASPEQIRGKLVSTASDVYSLGVVLYQLLTGLLPFDFTGRSPGEIERLVTDVEPTWPSVAVRREAGGTAGARESEAARPGLARSLAGDLDAIVLKALRPVPRERYRSVEQLAADLDRYRDGLPVEARRGSWRYRLGKRLRRHRAAVAVAGLVASMVIAFVVVTTQKSARVARERDQARIERDKKEQLLSLVMDVFTLGNPYVRPGEDLTVREALEHSVPLLEARLEDQPAIRAELLQTSGSILGLLERHEAAGRELEQALALQLEVYGERHPDVVVTLSALAGVRVGQGQLEEAESLARRALGISDALGQGPRARLVPLSRLASVLCYQNDFDALEPLARQNLRLARGIPAGSGYEVLSLEYLGQATNARGAYDEAASYYRQAIALRRVHYGERHPSQIPALINLGVALRRQDAFAAAEDAYAEALALQKENLGEEHVDPILLNNLAGVRFGRGDFAGAEALYREALEAIGGPTSGHWLVLHLELRLAGARLRQDQAAAVEPELRRLLAQVRATLGDGHWRMGQTESLLGASLSRQRRFDEAEPLVTGGFERLLASGAKERYKRDAFERLRMHFERADRPSDVVTFRRRLEGG